MRIPQAAILQLFGFDLPFEIFTKPEGEGKFVILDQIGGWTSSKRQCCTKASCTVLVRRSLAGHQEHVSARRGIKGQQHRQESSGDLRQCQPLITGGYSRRGKEGIPCTALGMLHSNGSTIIEAFSMSVRKGATSQTRQLFALLKSVPNDKICVKMTYSNNV